MANEYLTRTPTSTGNQRVFTISVWYKKSANNTVSSNGQLTFLRSGDTLVRFDDNPGYDDRIRYYAETPSGSNILNLIPSYLHRDNSGWQHILVNFDSTQSTDVDRASIYINGIKLTKFEASTRPAIDALTEMFISGTPINLGLGVGSEYFKGQLCDYFVIDGQALTPDVFGFYKQGKGYISAGSTQATDFRPGQWVPKTPRVIKTEINRRGGFGVNGFYLPMNDSRNFGADFHCDPNSIIKLNEDLPQPRVGVATTASVGLGYTDALRADPYAANLVLALPFVSGGLSSGFGDYSHIIRGSGSAKIVSVSGNTTIANVGTAETASIFYGSGAKFDGIDDFLTVPNSSDFSFGNGDFTVECWANFGNFSTTTSLVNVFENATARRSWSMEGRSSGGFRFEWWYDGSTSQSIDASANTLSRGQWNHFAMVRKGPTITGYINGVAVGIKTDVGSQSLYNNTTDPLTIGALFTSGTPIQDFTGYIQDLRIYKGVAKYTGGFDVPRPYTPVGIATWRAVPDTTANNFATWNPLYPTISGSNASYANGNLTIAESTVNVSQVSATIGVSTGKWYYEALAGNVSGGSHLIGIRPAESFTFNPQNRTSYRSDGSVYNDAGTTVQSGTTYTSNDIIGVAIDMNTRKLWFSKNGSFVYSGNPSAGTNEAVSFASTYTHYTPAVMFDNVAGTQTWDTNFGQNPTFSGNTTAGTFTDSNGKGLFKYQPPSGFLALCEDNLPTPAISDPGKHFKTVLYTGDGNSGRSIVGVGFTPDLVWLKSRTGAYSHILNDSIRRPGFDLYTDLTSAEESSSPSNRILSLNSDGFSLGSAASVNLNGSSVVAWCWRAGAGTTSINTNGSIPSVVSVNQDAGFSIVSYTGNATSGATVGHGLGKKPSFFIIKNRSAAGFNWPVYHSAYGATRHTILNGTNVSATFTGLFNDTEPTSNVFSIGNDGAVNTNGSNYISYCWAEIEGFSKFGSWVSNANADGPFIYCGFKPALVICKTASGDVSNWVIADSSRSSVNDGSTANLRANTSDTEATAAGGFTIDFLSNGFKLRQSGALNSAGLTNIFAAWAESPFQTANSK